MLKTIALIGLSAALGLPAGRGLRTDRHVLVMGLLWFGQQIPTQALTPRDRQWNFDHQGENQAIAGSEWLREHHMSPFPFPL